MKYLISLFLIIFCFFLTEAFAQRIISPNLPSKSFSTTPLATGPSVYGVFEGKSPCQSIARQLNIEVGAECIKLKWGLTLYQDSISHKPTNFKLDGTFFRKKDREGRWHIVHGTTTDSKAIIFQLNLGDPNGFLYLLKGDDNVLFILDKNKNFLVGNAQFSYTLNRVKN
jgi:hypothetical protein